MSSLSQSMPLSVTTHSSNASLSSLSSGVGSGSGVSTPTASALSLSTASLLKKAAYHGAEDRIVLDIGSFSCKVGLSWEPTPRRTYIPGVAEKKLGCANGFHAKSISFVPASFAALLATGQTIGLVLDCGYQEACALSIYGSLPLIACSKSVPLAGYHVSKRLKELVCQYGHIVNNTLGTSSIEVSSHDHHQVVDILQKASDTFWETLKATIVVAYPTRKDWQSHHTSTCKNDSVHDEADISAYYDVTIDSFNVVRIPTWVGYVAADVLFEGNEEGETLQGCLLDTLLKCHVTTRLELIQNILLCGGTCSIPGLEDRLRYEMQHLADEHSNLKSARKLVSKINFIYSPFQPSQQAWVGVDSLT
ncbi:hypothetical protein BDEG_20223 [Batrachochytrium dendrobatidis JEL423]|uniref:Uncharacterized protein n=1 Tax=Batrachochytrium dendrobatidis (strain JEL423) TaxID=403673 RepID=A0A177W7H1_BATDL|nr:hypothetical protein BDEG_20223 [Batrachochytrium dendrobatidis JEL423]